VQEEYNVSIIHTYKSNHFQIFFKALLILKWKEIINCCSMY